MLWASPWNETAYNAYCKANFDVRPDYLWNAIKCAPARTVQLHLLRSACAWLTAILSLSQSWLIHLTKPADCQFGPMHIGYNTLALAIAFDSGHESCTEGRYNAISMLIS